MCRYVGGNFLEDGGGENKISDNFPEGKFRPRHTTHRPDLDLDFIKIEYKIINTQLKLIIKRECEVGVSKFREEGWVRNTIPGYFLGSLLGSFANKDKLPHTRC